MLLIANFRSANGYLATAPVPDRGRPAATTAEYAAEQYAYQPLKTQRYLIPLLEQFGARTVVDVGCGVGEMAQTLISAGYDAYGVDLLEAEPLWAVAGEQGRSRERFAVVDPDCFRMPFADCSIDFIFSFGVIEHVGTADGHSARLPGYKAIRRQWVCELFRSLKIGGHMLLGGPNRSFPIDAAHGPDCAANLIERKVSEWTRLSIHRVWGEHFLWSYRDLADYLRDLPCSVEPRSIHGFLDFSRVPRLLNPMARAWVEGMPRRFLGTGCNPWMMALVEKTGN
jgi:SAM-dependent methyltransferase